MRYSQLLIPTVKEVPAEAEIPSHQLMLRAGFMRKLASGLYTYLPLGWRSLRKIMDIIRSEMNASGGQEISMPLIQPIELWQKTGRDADYGATMCTFKDRHGRVNALTPTAEEVVTSLVAAEISVYKQLPINLYQINTKFRDEFRPRFGVLRSREFIMKDAYSFNADQESLDKSYRQMYDAYCRIFQRCGLEYVVVEAGTGEMGGLGSHEFMTPCDNGEDVLVFTEDGEYAANLEKAAVDPLDKHQLDGVGGIGEPEQVHTPDVGTIEAVCGLLGTQPAMMIKTLIYTTANDETVVCVLRGDHELNPDKLVSLLGQGAELAGESVIQNLTGAAVGFAGPMGLAEKADKMIVDHGVAAMPVGVTGANETDYHIKNVVPGRDFPLTGENVSVADSRNAVLGDTFEGKKLVFKRGIEVGHVFKLGTKYTEKLGATYLDENGSSKTCLMGCYGIGVNRILASAIEIFFDNNGCVLPASIAPFEIEVLPLNGNSEAVVAKAEQIYNELIAAGADVLMDDRKFRPGVKFKDADLIGIPLRIVVGDRGLAEGNVEIKRRTDEKPILIPADEAVAEALKILDELYKPLTP